MFHSRVSPGLLVAIVGVICAAPAFGQSKTHLEVGERLAVNEHLVAPDRKSHAILHGDGNLCVYAGDSPRNKQAQLWCSNSARGNGEYHASLGPDANLCVYRGSGPRQNAPPPSSVWCWGDKEQVGGRYIVRVEGSALCAYEMLTFPGNKEPRPPRLLWASRKLNKLAGFAGR